MSEPFLAEVRIVGFNFAPRGWAFCDGQILPINQNQSLYSLLGTTYGGDGRTSFALPDMRGRTPMHVGNGHREGQKSGEETHTLSEAEMPSHDHVAMATTNNGNSNASTGKVLATDILTALIRLGFFRRENVLVLQKYLRSVASDPTLSSQSFQKLIESVWE